MALRRGKARSVRELGDQVAERQRILDEIKQLDIEKQQFVSKNEAKKASLQKRLDRLNGNIRRFYFEDGTRYFKKKTKTIFTIFGSVGSKVTKRLKFHEPLEVVIDNIIESGQVRAYLSVQLKEGALKKNPMYAESVGLEVVQEEIILISPPASNQN